MLRWAIRAVAANSYKNKAISESKRASNKANDAKREKDIDKKLNYLSEGLDSLADAVSHS